MLPKGKVCPTNLAITTEADCRYAATAIGKKFGGVAIDAADNIDCFVGSQKLVQWAPTSTSNRRQPGSEFKSSKQAICHAGMLACGYCLS